jgi:uncharacterized membrane protein YsdA (DUF1294 family)
MESALICSLVFAVSMQACFANSFELALLIWLGASGAVGFLTMGIDKARALDQQRRIPEISLYAISLVGGFWGVLLGAFIFHHKTSKPRFMFVVLGILIVWTVLLTEFRFVQDVGTCVTNLR